MSTTRSVIVVTVDHSNTFDAHEVERQLAAALCLDESLRDMSNDWPPRVELVAEYRHNGDETVLHRDGAEWTKKFL
jgi:hypothetical protein